MKKPQLQIIKEALERGEIIDRVKMFRRYRIADLRSRLSQVKNLYGLNPDRRTKKGVRYLEYALKFDV